MAFTFGTPSTQVAPQRSLFGPALQQQQQPIASFGGGIPQQTSQPSMIASSSASAPGVGVSNLQPMIEVRGRYDKEQGMEHPKLALVVSGPEVYGDERDAVLSKLNQFLAAVGTGKGYFHSSQLAQQAGVMGPQLAPYEFKPDNIFHRLKGVVYNRLSQHKNADGIVSLILNVGANLLESTQQRQKLIDTLNGLLRKPQPVSTMIGLGATQRQSTINVHTELKSIVPLENNHVELVLCVRELGRGIWSASQLYGELKNSESILKQNLNCVAIVPHIEADKSELQNYLTHPLPGFEALWAQAVKMNPEPERLVPFPIQGFAELIKRQRMQKTSIAIQGAMLNELVTRLSRLDNDVFTACNSYVGLNYAQKALSHRLLRVVCMQLLFRRYGSILSTGEEELQCRLESLTTLLSAHGQLKSRLSTVLTLMQREGESIKQRAHEIQANSFPNLDVAEMRRCLDSRKALLDQLTESVNASKEVMDVVRRARDRSY